MRTFPSARKSWSSRDRMALLGNDSSPSPPASPTTPTPYSISGSGDLDAETMSMFTSLAGSNFPDPPSKVPSVRGHQQHQNQISPPSSSSGAIQFIPAYKVSVSPTDTHPLTSPEDSFDKEDKNHHHQNRPTIRHRPQVTTPSTAASTNTTNSNSYRSNNNTGSSSETGRRRGPRMARLASLFSSRAAVKMAAKNSQKPLEESSPPDSDTSSGYVGWPGTQDKRGKTVVVDSSYTDSEPGPSKEQEGDDSSSWNDDNILHTPTEKYATTRHTTKDADFHLTSALVNAAAAANSPIVAAEKQHRMSNHPMHGRVTSLNDIYGHETGGGEEAFQAVSHPWAMNTSTSDDAVSDVSTSFSKTSSAYFNPNEVRALARGKIKHLHAGSATTGRPKQDHVAAAVMRLQKSGDPPRLTDEALALKNQLTPPHRVLGNATNAVGYRGYIDKTKDVPNLMDDTESDSSSSRATSLHSARSASRYRQNRKAMLNKIGNDDDQILEEASSDIFDGVQNGRLGGGGGVGGADAESDVFDGVSNAGSQYYHRRGAAPRTAAGGFEDNKNQYGGEESGDSQMSPTLVLLGGGLTSIQTSVHDFTNRKTASDFDENLTNSDYDQYGFAKVPGFNEMASMGTSSHDRSLGSNTEKLFADPSPASFTNLSARAKEAIERHRFNACDQSGSESGSSLFSNPYSVSSHACSSEGISQYYVHPDKMKTVVKYYRKMNKKHSPHLNYEDLLNEEDATKAFALSEMRSRIMEKDIERGLERKGGTTVVDDIVLTDYNKSALRVRDAVIVSKAWRDGARPMDVINTAFLTRRSTRSYHIPRLANRRFSRGNGRHQQLTWEEVLWVDDLELSQFRCHSIGPRDLRGFEMFTIGDCQSILLKLCRDQCEDLHSDLNEATARQIEAEEVMKEEEGDGVDGMMTEAEMTYLAAMEEVKTYSKKLVIAEKSFNLVKERIENLVAKYESLLVKFDNDAESVAPSSVITYESSCYSDAYTNASEVEREREELLRRAERAEVRAELAAREALLARKESREAQVKNQLELQALHQRLDELQSEPSAAVTDRDHSVVLARAIAAQNRSVLPKQNINNDIGGAGPSTPSAPAPKSSSKIDDVKRRFRDRSAAKKRGVDNGSSHQHGGTRAAAASSSSYRQIKTPAQRERENLYRQVGEEMFQQMDFYERSLKAVETDRKF